MNKDDSLLADTHHHAQNELKIPIFSFAHEAAPDPRDEHLRAAFTQAASGHGQYGDYRSTKAAQSGQGREAKPPNGKMDEQVLNEPASLEEQTQFDASRQLSHGL